jgi:hypothetical protein
MHAAKSGNTAHHRIDDRLYKSTGQGGIDCIAPGTKNIRTSLYSIRL